MITSASYAIGKYFVKPSSYLQKERVILYDKKNVSREQEKEVL